MARQQDRKKPGPKVGTKFSEEHKRALSASVSRFWKKNLAPDERFKAPQELRREFDALLGGMSPAQTVHMCGSGVTACHNIFAMELAGLPGARLYPGSWSEWCSDRARPMAQGS